MIEVMGKRAMVLAPHTDDGELGCGATIAKLVERGADVFYTAFSVCEQSVPYGFRQDELERELMAAMNVLNIPLDHVFIHRYPVRHFPAHRQEILQNIIDRRKEISPDMVFIPCLDDIHQDHQTIAMEGLRAYKQKTILSYEMPWNNLSINTSAFSMLEDRHLQKKIDALACYKTQAFRPYANTDFLRGLAVTRGSQIGVPLAEAFQLVRLAF